MQPEKFYIKHPKKNLVLGRCGAAVMWLGKDVEDVMAFETNSEALLAVQENKLTPNEFVIRKGSDL